MSTYYLVNPIVVNAPIQSTQLKETSPIKPVTITSMELLLLPRIESLWAAANYYLEYVQACGVATAEDIKAADSYLLGTESCLLLAANLNKKPQNPRRPAANEGPVGVNSHVLTPISLAPSEWSLDLLTLEQLHHLETVMGLSHEGDKEARVLRMRGVYRTPRNGNVLSDTEIAGIVSPPVAADENREEVRSSENI